MRGGGHAPPRPRPRGTLATIPHSSRLEFTPIVLIATIPALWWQHASPFGVRHAATLYQGIGYRQAHECTWCNHMEIHSPNFMGQLRKFPK